MQTLKKKHTHTYTCNSHIEQLPIIRQPSGKFSVVQRKNNIVQKSQLK